MSLMVSSTPSSLMLLVAHAGGTTPMPIITADAATAPANFLIFTSTRPLAELRGQATGTPAFRRRNQASDDRLTLPPRRRRLRWPRCPRRRCQSLPTRQVPLHRRRAAPRPAPPPRRQAPLLRAHLLRARSAL